MNELLPIIRRVRRPLVKPHVAPQKNAETPKAEPALPMAPAVEAAPTERPVPETPNEADTDY